MAPGLAFTGTFIDVTRPVNIITFPSVNSTVTNAELTAAGKAEDNVGVASVWYQLNAGGCNPATTTNQFTDWTTPVLFLTTLSNLIQAYAVDDAGNTSLTNTVKFRLK